MGTRLVDWLFGCWHSNYSFPMSVKRGKRRPVAAALTGTYVVCLDCGKEFPYDWEEMRVLYSDAPRKGSPDSLPVSDPIQLRITLR